MTAARLSSVQLPPEFIDVGGAPLEVMNGDPNFIPEEDPHYQFNPYAAHIAHDIGARKNVLLTGHTGTGKTSVVDQLAARSKQGVIRVNMNGQTTIGDFVGLYTVIGGETVWVDGALPLAMRQGLWLLVDEVDFAEAPILSVMNPVLERGGKLLLKERGHEVVKPHENFRIFATANTVGCMQRFRHLYQGTNVMNEAWLDRWHVYHVDYMQPRQELEVLMSRYPEIPLQTARNMVTVATKARAAFDKGDLSSTFSTRRLMDWGEMLVRYRDPIVAASMTIYAKIPDEDRMVLEATITRLMVGAPMPEATPARRTR